MPLVVQRKETAFGRLPAHHDQGIPDYAAQLPNVGLPALELPEPPDGAPGLTTFHHLSEAG